ncbi:MAG: hypothetical protein R3F19_27255 [Verrucomicrobiales bacterium]
MERLIWYQALHPQAARMQQEQRAVAMPQVPMERKAVSVPLMNLMLVQTVATHQSLSLRQMEMPDPTRRMAMHLALGHLMTGERAAENALAEHRRTESAH